MAQIEQDMEQDDIALADRMKHGRQRIIEELKKLIIGQDEVVNQVLLTLFVGGKSALVADKRLLASSTSPDKQSRSTHKTS